MKLIELLENVDIDHREMIAKEYVRLHNLAAKEYQLAFKSIGAKMWPGDYARPIKT